MDEHPNAKPPTAEEASPLTEEHEREAAQQKREPSVPEVAQEIATRLQVTDQAARTRIKQIVWDLGRTQAKHLCAEALEVDQAEVGETPTPSKRFFQLVKTKGVKKQRSWPGKPEEQKQREAWDSRVQETAHLIAEQLGEQEAAPRQTIVRSVSSLGVEAALAVLQQAQEIEATGGMMLPDGSRRRTPGGVYFYLVRQRVTPAQRYKIFPSNELTRAAPPISPQPAGAASSERTASPLRVRLTWEERGQILDEAEQETGGARSVKVTIIGRPGKVVERGQCVAFAMQQGEKIPSLPAGLPLPSAEQAAATRYHVYVALKQWRRVAEPIADPEDVLIIEGWQLLDRERGTIAVFASNVTTKKLQMQSRQPKA